MKIAPNQTIFEQARQNALSQPRMQNLQDMSNGFVSAQGTSRVLDPGKDAQLAASASAAAPQTTSTQSLQEAAPNMTAAVQGGGLVKRGQSGDQVRELQTLLNQSGINPPLETDGVFGRRTRRAVMEFQERTGIKVDGLVGPETLGQLERVQSGQITPANPSTPANPATPANPSVPANPADPSAPANPADPSAPAAPTNPAAAGQVGDVIGSENTTPEFRAKVAEIAGRLGMDPTHLMAVMSFETGGSFSPSERNRTSGATGLIQFMPSTARGLGTSTSELAQMSPMQQLDYVEKYLEPYAGKMNTVEDAYMAVLWPAAVGRGPSHTLFRQGTAAYRQNSGLDTNGDGRVTAQEAAAKVRARIR